MQQVSRIRVKLVALFTHIASILTKESSSETKRLRMGLADDMNYMANE